MKALNILVLAGGPGSEREISLWSGKLVTGALSAMGHRVRQADISPDDLGALEDASVELVFPVIHGSFGEDGQLQRILEEQKLRYVGSDAVSSELAMDKHRSKLTFSQAELMTPDWLTIPVDQASKWKHPGSKQIDFVLGQLSFPMVVKPNAEGSSVGVSIVRSAEELGAAVYGVLRDYGACMIEQFIPGREMTVGIVGDLVLPVLEIRPEQGFYDWQAKYVADTTQYIFDTGLDEERLGRMAREARKAFEALGCRDFGRVDFIADSEGRDWLLEVNTLPGMTDHSLLPKAAGKTGLGYNEFCQKIVQIAWDRPNN